MTDDLPSGWTEQYASALCSLITSGSRGWAKYYADAGAGFIRVQNVRRGRIDLNFDNLQHVRPPSNVEGSRTRLQPNDVVITITADLGRVGLVSDTVGEAYVNQHVALARPTDAIVPAYLAWFITGPNAQDQLGLLDRGATRSGLGLKDIQGLRVPLPPLAEQRLIVARVEALFARTRRIQADLQRVVALTAHYMMRALEQLFDLGDHSWPVEPVSNLATAKLGKMLDEAKNTAGHPLTYLRNINVRWFAFDLSDLLAMRFTDEEAARFSIRDRDVFVCEGGEPGRAAVWRGGRTDIKFQKALHRLRPKEGIQPDWLAFGLRYLADSGQLAKHFTGTTIKHLPSQALATVRLPLPPAEVQIARIAEFQQTSARIESQRREATRTLALLDRLEQSILARAFRGELVLQDPVDEPVQLPPAPITSHPRRRRAAPSAAAP